MLATLTLSAQMLSGITVASDYIAAGRVALFQNQDVPTAHARFGYALALEPNNPEANVFYAVTTLGMYLTSDDCGALLTKAGGAELFWDPGASSPLRGIDPDTLESISANDIMNPDRIADETTYFELISGLNDSAIEAIDDAQAHLAVFTSASPDIVLTVAEMNDPDITSDIHVDEGDILLLRSFLKCITGMARVANGYNSSAGINACTESEDMESFMEAFPDALKVVSPGTWTDAKARLESAASLYDNASDIIRARKNDSSRGLFHITPDADFADGTLEDGNVEVRESKEDVFRTSLTRFIDAFNSVQTETVHIYSVSGYDPEGYPTWSLDEHTLSFTLAPFVNGQVDFRSLLPEIRGGLLIRNTFPDPTMDGLLPDADQATLDMYVQGANVNLGGFNSYERSSDFFSQEYVGGWLGYLYYFPEWECGWYYSAEHGFVFPDYESGVYWLYQDTLYLYVADFNSWIYTNKETYPWMYRYSDGGAWLYYWPGQKAASRWYYNCATSNYEHVTETK